MIIEFRRSLYFFKTQMLPQDRPFMLVCRYLYLFFIVYPVKLFIYCFTGALYPLFSLRKGLLWSQPIAEPDKDLLLSVF